MIDTHCHVDLFPDPVGVARLLERELSACVAVTMLPSHFEMARRHLAGFRRVRPALGLHPLRARKGRPEIPRFRNLARSAEFIGEIGIDGSSEGRSTLEAQKENFAEIAASIQAGAFVTVHSRGAWRETLEGLKLTNLRPVCFHYFTGGTEGAKAVLSEGHYFSVNHRMIAPDSRHREMIAALPRVRVLVETDGPFLGAAPVEQLESVYRFLELTWQLDSGATRQLVRENFSRCRTTKAAPPFQNT